MGWIKNDKVFQELRKKIGELADVTVKVGVLEGDEEVETEHGTLTMTELATIHEFGAPGAGIPERSFIRKTFTDDRGREELAKFQAEQARQVVDGKLSARNALKRIGTWGAAKVRERIRAHIAPELKPATVKRKGSSTPLVDTGALANAVSYELEENDE